MKEKVFIVVLLTFLLSLTCLSVHISHVRADTYNQIPLWINILEGEETSEETIDKIEKEIDSIFQKNGLNWRVTSCVLDDSMEDPDKTKDKPGDIRIGEGLDFTGEEGYLWGLGEDETKDRSGFKIFVANKILNETGQDDGTNGISLRGSFRTAVVKGREENETKEAARTWAHEIGHLFGLDHTEQDGTNRSANDLMYPFAQPWLGTDLQPEDIETMKKVKKEQALGLPTTTNRQHDTRYFMFRFSLPDEKEDTEPWFPDEADIIKIDFSFYELDETKEFHITTFFGGVLPRGEDGFRYFITVDTDNNATTGGELEGWLGIDLLIGVDVFEESIIATLYSFPDLVPITPVEARVDTHCKFIDMETPPEIPPKPIQDSIVVNLQQEILGSLSDPINIGALITTDQGDVIDKLETTPMSTSPPERPNLSLNPPVATSGSTITATGNGFTPNDNISIIFNHVTVSVAEVEFDGSFQASLTVPELPVDHYMIDAIDDSYNIGVNMFTLTFGADLNRDESVNILDISIVAIAFATKEGDTNYNPIADLDDNKQINIIDVSKVAVDYGKTV